MLLSQKSDTFIEAIGPKLIKREDVGKWASSVRLQGKTIATLNGSFDLLHAGHLEMIYQASLQADVLLVALNSDSSIKRYKSPHRPIIPLGQRQKMMAALSMVDFVTHFDETDPREILKIIRPHVHVNGAEYGYDCIERDVVEQGGGKIHIVSLVPELSTSNIIKKIQQICD